MSAASRYWTLIRIDASGRRISEALTSAKAFFLASFPDYVPQSEVPDALIQRQLLHWMKEATEQYTYASPRQGREKGSDEANRVFLAECCLKCFISSQIERVCQQLATQFGEVHGFTCGDLLRCVLDEDSSRFRRDGATSVSTSSYQSLPQEILRSFNPDQSSLATWTTRLVKHSRELNAFLLEHGVYLISDWAILNDTTAKQLQRVFSQFHSLTEVEIQQAQRLLDCYHAVYRVQRLQSRKTGIKGHCLPPTREQLQQISQCLSTKIGGTFRSEAVLAKLQEMASRLREYRIHVRGGALPADSIDAPVITNSSSERSVFRDFIDERNTVDEQTEFLHSYRQQFITCLDQAIARVIEEQVRKLESKKNPQKAEQFLTALQLFHCKELSMVEIAKAVNLQAQFHVSRLLKLKAFRADIQQEFLVLLRDCVTNQVKAYCDPERLQSLNHQIQEALDEQVTQVIQEAATEASTATGTKKQTHSTSLFAERLCRYLDTRSSSHV
jgi:hypothetical protein